MDWRFGWTHISHAPSGGARPSTSPTNRLDGQIITPTPAGCQWRDLRISSADVAETAFTAWLASLSWRYVAAPYVAPMRLLDVEARHGSTHEELTAQPLGSWLAAAAPALPITCSPVQGC